MTQEEFDSLRFRVGMLAEYRDGWYKVVSCNFYERLFALCDGGSIEDEEPLWVRCENVTRIEYANL